MRGGCVFWEGPLFGRLTKSGKEYLVKRGWRHLEELSVGESTKRLALIWPSKSGPQFEVNDTKAAHIRPYPKHVTDVVEDKVRLAQALEGEQSMIFPNCIASPEEANSDGLYFVKHRYGAQGKSVYVYNKQDLHEWWSRSRNPQDFVIQEEIPPALYEGRKFVLRSHILMIQRDGHILQSYLHKTVICQHHATVYNKHSREKSSQISQAGKRHPLPVLLEDLDPQHPAAHVFPKIESCSKQLLLATFDDAKWLIGRDTTCFALLGTDLLVDDNGAIKICEVNSHPALGWGTMSKVPSKLFSDLIEETLMLLIDGDDRSTDFLPL